MSPFAKSEALAFAPTMKTLKTQNYYQVLGVARFASLQEIEDAYQLAQRTYGQDGDGQDSVEALAAYSLFSEDDSSDLLDGVQQAYDVLSRVEWRRAYDMYLERLEKYGSQVAGERFDPHAPLPRSVRSRPDAALVSAPGYRGGKRERVVGRLERLRREPKPPTTPPMASPERVQKVAPKQRAEDQQFQQWIRSLEKFDGPTLAEVRSKLGFDLDQLSDITKIRRAYLERIEREDFAHLPGKIYTKGFVMIIARTLNLPLDRVISDYMQRYPR